MRRGLFADVFSLVRRDVYCARVKSMSRDDDKSAQYWEQHAATKEAEAAACEGGFYEKKSGLRAHGLA